jgi:dihydrofolate synthase/folylpolyglutamate synthase
MAAKRSIKHYFGDEKVIAVSGVLRDKEYEKIADHIAEVADIVFTITPDSPRALSATDYARVLEKRGLTATPCESIFAALIAAKEVSEKNKSTIVMLGSLYTYGEVKANLKRL